MYVSSGRNIMDGHLVFNIIDRVISSKHHPLKINISGRFPLVHVEDNDKLWFIAEPNDFDKMSACYTNISIICYNVPNFYMNVHSNLIYQVLYTKRGVEFKTGCLPGYTNEFILQCDDFNDDEWPEYFYINSRNIYEFEIRISMDALRNARIKGLLQCIPKHCQKINHDLLNGLCKICLRRLSFHTTTRIHDCICMNERLEMI